jgi:hypothetical protein
MQIKYSKTHGISSGTQVELHAGIILQLMY